MIAKISAAMLCIALAGCATRASDITAAYVSPVGYRALTCEQLALEAQAVSSRAAAASGVQDKKASGDAVAMTVGLVVFWPALFFMKGDGAPAAEVSRLKGEMDAIEAASVTNNCGIKFAKPAPPAKTATPNAGRRD